MSGKQKLDIGAVRIHEHAVVTATCAAGLLRPRTITLPDRALEIADILQQWTGVHHGARLRYFLVLAADGSRWKLCFQSQQCSWLVEEVCGAEVEEEKGGKGEGEMK